MEDAQLKLMLSALDALREGDSPNIDPHYRGITTSCPDCNDHMTLVRTMHPSKRGAVKGVFVCPTCQLKKVKVIGEEDNR